MRCKLLPQNFDSYWDGENLKGPTYYSEVDKCVPGGCFPEVDPAPVLAGIAPRHLVDPEDGWKSLRTELSSGPKPFLVRPNLGRHQREAASAALAYLNIQK